MPELETSILIVEDEEPVRSAVAQVLIELGNRVRSASDGLTALNEMGYEAPGILLSDLSMPGMSGYLLLSVVRRLYPAVRVIALSRAFSGTRFPCGVIADASYTKGYGVAHSVRVVETLTLRKLTSRNGVTLANVRSGTTTVW